jgi:hypothetical protein
LRSLCLLYSWKVSFQGLRNIHFSVRKTDEIVTWLFPGDPNSRQEYLREHRCPDTGGWFMEKFKQWIVSDSKLLLCGGMGMLTSIEKAKC